MLCHLLPRWRFVRPEGPALQLGALHKQFGRSAAGCRPSLARVVTPLAPAAVAGAQRRALRNQAASGGRERATQALPRPANAHPSGPPLPPLGCRPAAGRSCCLGMTRLPAPEAPVFHPTLHDVSLGGLTWGAVWRGARPRGRYNTCLSQHLLAPPPLRQVNSMTFVEYVERVVEKSKAFREAGICRIVAPDGWCAPPSCLLCVPRWQSRCGARGLPVCMPPLELQVCVVAALHGN